MLSPMYAYLHTSSSLWAFIPIIVNWILFASVVAASICSRKEHKFQQTELQVKYLPTPSPVAYEMDKLILENVPEGIEEDYLILFIMNCLGIVEDDFSITRSNDKVLLVLSREYSLTGKSQIPVQHHVYAVYIINAPHSHFPTTVVNRMQHNMIQFNGILRTHTYIMCIYWRPLPKNHTFFQYMFY